MEVQAAAPLGGSVDQWLNWQLSLHSSRIELGLERVREVAQRLNVLQPAQRCVVVAGTNGKGSTVCLVENLLRAQGYTVGAYTSPHLWHYNERVRIGGQDATDEQLCQAFTAVEAARQDVHLTFFEFGTLAAFWLFKQQNLDYAVLEIGLGGRLDAVNIVPADVSILTNVGLDHSAFLGDTREAVGYEKSGIMRQGQPTICTDRDVPQSVLDHAQEVAADLRLINRDFSITAQQWQGCEHRFAWQEDLPAQLHLDNLAAALAALQALGEALPTQAQLNQALIAHNHLPGRREVVDNTQPELIFDVAHNVPSAQLLADFLSQRPCQGQTHLVIGMLGDKPVEQVGAVLCPHADMLYPAGLDTINPRGISSQELAQRLGKQASIHPIDYYNEPAAALAAAKANAAAHDRIVICGSFFTVAQTKQEG